MAELYLPSTLQPLFAGLPRHLELDAATVDEALDRLEERWPGFGDRLCEPGPELRRHNHGYVDRQRAPTLSAGPLPSSQDEPGGGRTTNRRT